MQMHLQQCILELGRSASEYLTELTHRRARLWLRDTRSAA